MGAFLNIEPELFEAMVVVASDDAAVTFAIVALCGPRNAPRARSWR